MLESELLNLIYQRSKSLTDLVGVVVGPGDDAAVVRWPVRSESESGAVDLLLTVDQLVEARHFEAGRATTDQVAHKAIARAVSDIAAMGGRPLWGLAAGALSKTLSEPDRLFEAMASEAMRYQMPLIGGDIAATDGPGVLTVTVVGAVHPHRGPVLRSEARTGDWVYVTGRIGGSLASGRHLSFEPRLEEAGWLCDQLGDDLHAMIDLSDGLGRDGGRIATASGCRIELEAEAIPLHPDVSDWRQAAGDGEDYELLFTSPRSPEALPPTLGAPATPLTCIGRISAGRGCWIRDRDGQPLDAVDLGWDHQT